MSAVGPASTGGSVSAVAPPPTELQRRRWYVLTVMSIGSFMTPLDASIVAVALPSMGSDLQLSYSAALWVQAAYLLVTSILLIPAGRLADRGGPVRYYLLGTAVFALGSIVAALSVNGPMMIAARCVQGVGGAFVYATAVGIITSVFPAEQRGKALGFNLMATYFGLTAGPVVGGVIVANAQWPWIFLINLPIAFGVVLAGLTLLRAERRDRRAAGPAATAATASASTEATSAASRRRRMDIPGPVLLGGVLVAFFTPLTFSPLWGWGNTATVTLLVAAAVLFVAFILVERRVPDPMLDLDLLTKNRVFAAANSAALLNYVAIFAITTLVAVYLVVVQGLSADRTGLVMLAQPILMMVLSPFTGRLSDRIAPRFLAAIGQTLITLGMVQLALVSSSVMRVVVALATVGVGMAFFSAPNVSAIMGSVSRSQLNLASGFQSTMRFAGQGISMAVLGAIAAWKLGVEGGRIIFLGEAGGQTSALGFADGFRAAMLAGAALAFAGAVVSLVGAKKPREPALAPRDRPASG